jgi:hypothetical protein
MRFGLHHLVKPFEGALLNLVYLSKMSEWKSKNKANAFDDFYSSKFDTNIRVKVFQKLFDTEKLNCAVDYLEFGVASGRSFKWWVNANTNPDSVFTGFDTFTGLPENWDVFKAGDMTQQGNIPDVNDKRATFQKGLFQETLPKFLENYNFKSRKIIHLDADLYSSTLYALTMLAPYLKEGDILIFDEFAVPTHEFKAFLDFKSSFYFKFELIYAGNNYLQSAFKIIDTKPEQI